MQRIRILIPLVGILVLSIACCSLAGIYWDGYYLPFKPCRPIIYPDGQSTGEQLSYSAKVPLDSVILFYDQRLNVRPYPADTGQWRREQISQSKYLYSCFGVDINWLTAETGCIYVSGDIEITRIETRLLRGEGGSSACPKK